MNARRVITLIIFVFFISCKDSDTYIKHHSGFEYKIITDTEHGIFVKKDNILDLSLKYFTQKDSLIFNSEDLSGKFRVMIFDSIGGGFFQEALKLMKIGDSAQFLIPASDFYENTIYIPIPDFMDESENIRIDVKINNIVSQKELDKEYEMYLLKMEAQENSLLQEYLTKRNITVVARKSGLYIIPLEIGKGKKAQTGKKVIVHYQGTLINGQIFDSSIDKGKAFEFVLGRGDVIPAWDEAIAGMRVGDKVRIITPSKLAYGEHGAGKLIPPFASLIFEIKLIDIKENNTKNE